VINTINKIIEFKLFKPIATSIIVSFLLFQGFEYSRNLLIDYRESSSKKTQVTPIKIDISGANLNINESQIIEYRIKKGDTILKILFDIGAGDDDIFSILRAMKKIISPTSIVVGTKIEISFNTKISYDASNLKDSLDRRVVIKSVSISKSVEEKAVISRTEEESYAGENVKIKLTKRNSKYSGTIRNSLFVDGVASGVSPNSMMNMINLYGYDVDFQRDIRKGDKFEILVESFHDEEGRRIKDGNVLFSSLTLGKRKIDAYMHHVRNAIEYFDEKGRSIKKSLLRTPVNGARISSGFGLRRHPILGYSKMHKGTDFSAPRGTPILAAGNGTIVYRGRRGGYGNYVKIKHNSEYSTAYAHASKFSRKFRKGSRVKQGDIIAYVGSTGRSTGPHLHFEVLRRGKQINPSKVKATSGIKLSGNGLSQFKKVKAVIDRYRQNIPNQTAKSE
jgi:murein DD-endopeptidase MepM/ murein hydrolase activator NlpD